MLAAISHMICLLYTSLRIAVPDEYFVGRDGGDEFIVVLNGVTRAHVEKCLLNIRKQTETYSKEHPEMPIS